MQNNAELLVQPLSNKSDADCIHDFRWCNVTLQNVESNKNISSKVTVKMNTVVKDFFGVSSEIKKNLIISIFQDKQSDGT